MLTKDGIPILKGYNQIKIRCIAENGAISPIMEQIYNGKISFDSTDWYTAEDGKYEYVCGITNDGLSDTGFYHSTGTVFRYPKDGTSLHYNDALFLWKAETKKNITAIAVCSDKAADGSLQHTLQMIHNKTTVYTDVLKNSEKGSMTEQENTKAIYKVVGNGWRRYRNVNGTIRMDGTYATGGNQKVAEWADLLTDEYAIKCVRKPDAKKSFIYNYTVYMMNPNGSGEEVEIWATQDEVVLDAIIGSKLLYHYDDCVSGKLESYRHMVYDLKTGEHRERTDMTSSYNNRQYTLVGYTSEAAYVCGLSVGEVVRVPIDYDAL